MSQQQQEQQQGVLQQQQQHGGSSTEAPASLQDILDVINKIRTDMDKKLTDMDKKLTDMDKKLTDMDKKVTDMDKKFVEMDTKIDKKFVEMDTKIDTNHAYLTGTYYTQLSDIWGTDSIEFNGAAEDLMVRRAKDIEAIKAYSDEDFRLQIKYDERTYPKMSLFPTATLSRAHGCTNDITCSLTWGPNLDLITGYGAETSCLLSNEDFRYFVEGKNPDLTAEGETQNTPIKALSWNFLKVAEHHEDHFDKVSHSSNTGMILAPVWNHNEEWKPRTSYSIIVAATPETYKWLMGTPPPSLSSPPPQMKWLSEADDDDLQLATDFLSLTVRANADLLVQCGEELAEAVKNLQGDEIENPDESGPANRLEEVLFSVQNGVNPSDLFSTKSESTKASKSLGKESKQKKKVAQQSDTLTGKIDRLMNVRDDLRNVRTTVTEDPPKVCVPVKTASVKDSGARILKVDLGVYFEETRDFIPDPYLWALKAASSWGGYMSQKSLMACDVYGPGGKTQNDDSYDMTEDPPSEIAAMGNGLYDESSLSSYSVSSVSVCMTDSDGEGNPKAVTPERVPMS